MTVTPPPTPPPDNSVVAGPIGFTVFILLILAVALLCWSFTKQLKKANAAKDAGVYGDEPVDRSADSDEASERHDADA
jgi:hypothetical protein